MPNNNIRTRFAPSPTGYMHVGNLRTALYTYLMAKHDDGTFILRIEDPDQGRLIEGATDVIYRTLAECGLDHDEGPDVGGPVAPYIQSERRDTYGKYAELLVERGGAYYSDAACEVINAIYNDKQTEHYVNIPHHGHVDNIPADWAVEMSCTLGRDGAKPTPRITHFDEKVLGLIYTIKGFEVAASQAAISGELNDVLLALNLSPLIHSDRDAEQLAREMILAHEKWLPNFAATIEKLKS